MSSILIGSVVGASGALLGVGGAFVGVPMLTSRLLCNLSQKQAQGTIFPAMALTSAAGALAYYLSDRQPVDRPEGAPPSPAASRQRPFVNVPAAFILAIGGIASVRIGARLASSMNNKVLSRCFGSFLLLTPGLMYLKSNPSLLSQIPSLPPSLFPAPLPSLSGMRSFLDAGSSVLGIENALSALLVDLAPWSLTYLATVGIAGGFFSGLLSVGGGLLVTPLLCLAEGASQTEAVATSLLAMVPTTLMGTWTHYRLGTCVCPLVPGLLLGTVLGVFVGKYLATAALKEEHQRILFSSLMWILAVRSFRK